MTLGGTITELQGKMSQNEVSVWQKYRAKHGPMSDRRRYDQPAALLGTIINAVNGRKIEMSDLLPYHHQEQAELSLDDVMKAFGPGVKIAKRR